MASSMRERETETICEEVPPAETYGGVYILLDDNAEQSVLDLVVVVCTHLFSTVAWL